MPRTKNSRRRQDAEVGWLCPACYGLPFLNRPSPSALRLESLDLRLESRNLRFESLDLRLESRKLLFESLDLRLESLELQLESLDLQLESLDLWLEFRDLRFESLDLRLESFDLRLEPLDLWLESFGPLLESRYLLQVNLGRLERSCSPLLPTEGHSALSGGCSAGARLRGRMMIRPYRMRAHCDAPPTEG
jgi:hypothetical protein